MPGARFLHAQHIGQLALISGDHQHARQIPPLQRHLKQEAQGRDRAIDRRRSDAVLMLRELETSNILADGCITSAPKEGGEAPDMPDVVLLGMPAQAAHQHILLHALAERCDGSVGRRGSHGEFLSLKGTPWSDRGPSPTQRPKLSRSPSALTHPAKRVRARGAFETYSTLLRRSAFGMRLRSARGALQLAASPVWWGRWLSNFCRFSQLQRVLDVDAEIANCVLDLGVAEQDLDCTQIACRLLDS